MSEHDKSWIQKIAVGIITAMLLLVVTTLGGMYRSSIVQNERDCQNKTLFQKIDNKLENFENKIDNIKDNYVKKNDYENDKQLMMIRLKTK